MTTTTPLPEPTHLGWTPNNLDPIYGYTADQLHAHAAAMTESIKQVATLNAEISMILKDQLAAKDAEIERLRADAARWVWWAEAVANHDLNSIEKAFKDIPHDQTTSKQALDVAVDAALKESK